MSSTEESSSEDSDVELFLPSSEESSPEEEMIQFDRNWNVFGMGQPLLFPIERAGQPEIHLAKLLKEFFEFDCGKCVFNEYKVGCY